jgi:hypothetical protein
MLCTVLIPRNSLSLFKQYRNAPALVTGKDKSGVKMEGSRQDFSTWSLLLLVFVWAFIPPICKGSWKP